MLEFKKPFIENYFQALSKAYSEILIIAEKDQVKVTDISTWLNKSSHVVFTEMVGLSLGEVLYDKWSIVEEHLNNCVWCQTTYDYFHKLIHPTIPELVHLMLVDNQFHPISSDETGAIVEHMAKCQYCGRLISLLAKLDQQHLVYLFHGGDEAIIGQIETRMREERMLFYSTSLGLKLAAQAELIGILAAN